MTNIHGMASQSLLLQVPPRIDLTQLPRWLTETYEGMEKDIEPWLISHYFWRTWDGREETVADTTVLARANATARYKTLMQTNVLRGASEKSVMYQLSRANTTGWFRFVNEMDSIDELLEEMERQAKESGSGAYYELRFLIKTLIPTLRQMGVPEELIVAIPANRTKAKAAVAPLRQIIQTNGPEMKDNIMAVLQDIPDPTITTDEFRRRNRERLGKSTPAPVTASVYLIPGNELIVIKSDRAHTEAITHATRGIVDGFDIRDATVLLRDLGQQLLPKSNSMVRLRLIDKRFVEDPEGVQFPSIDSLFHILLTETAHCKWAIDSIVDSKGHCSVPLFEFHKAYFKNAIEDLEEAVATYYTIPENTVSDILPGCRVFIGIEEGDEHYEIVGWIE